VSEADQSKKRRGAGVAHWKRMATVVAAALQPNFGERWGPGARELVG
jgi:hypothetical protein